MMRKYVYMDRGIHAEIAPKHLEIMSLTNTINLLMKPDSVVAYCTCFAIPPGLTFPLP